MKTLKYIIFFILFFSLKVHAENCFENGISSGDPNQNSFIIWSKLTCSKEENSLVNYEISIDNKFENIVRKGEIETNKDRDNTIKVLIDNMKPDFDYYYRFSYKDNYSDIGKTITLPYKKSKIKIAFISCQNYSAGFFTAYKSILDLKPDLVIMLGDFIYEFPRKVHNSPRFDETPHAKNLKTYREKYSYYLKDPYLQELLKNIPIIPVWDDHEVANDYSGKELKKKNPDLIYSAYKTYYEYLPIRENKDFKIYRNIYIPDLINIALIDGRQYRDKKVCERGINFNCNELSKNPNLEYLGEEQKEWLKDLINNNKKEWFVLANNTVLMDLKLFGNTINFDQWDGFYREKNELLEFISSKKELNFITVTGDIHVFLKGKLFFNNKIIANEYTTGSIASTNYPIVDLLQKFVPILVPNLDFIETYYKGFTIIEFSKTKANIKMYAMNSNKDYKGYFLLKEFIEEK